MVAPARIERTGIDRRRFRRVSWFFFKLCLHLFWRDIVLSRPLLRTFRSDPLPRWCALARRYRALAARMGGVLIKLGQYLSTRVDLLPLAVTRELAGLADEVPPAPLEPVIAQLEEDFRRPLGEIFLTFMDVPLGSASLAQVHEAQLLDGTPVVVKVLRPGIDVIVETDLRAIGRLIGWLGWWRFIRDRVDLDWLEEEFASTTRRELDMRLEAANVERFGEMFADDPGVAVPRIYHDYTARRSLTEENVAYVKVNDIAGLTARGIDPAAVARKLYRVYLEQIFVHHFVHADPHPGNLFVRPRPDHGIGEPDWQLVFIDFGMVGEIAPRLRQALRDYLIGLGTRDAARVIKSLRDAGTLQPGADLVGLEEALESLFDRFWGVELGRLNDAVLRDAAGLWKEFGQLLLETPIQIQVDLMFTGRAIELAGGLATTLDSDFNPWAVGVPFAERLAREELGHSLPQQLADLAVQARHLASLPGDLSRVVNQAGRGRLTLRSALAPDSKRQLRRLERSLDFVGHAVLAGGMLIGGARLYSEQVWLGGGLMGLAALVTLLALLRRGR